MNFLADEGVDFPVVQRLRGEGHEVLYVAEMAPGASDEMVLTTANDKSALLLIVDKDLVCSMNSPVTGVPVRWAQAEDMSAHALDFFIEAGSNCYSLGSAIVSMISSLSRWTLEPPVTRRSPWRKYS